MDYKRELLGGSSFLERYQEPLNSLCRNQRFVDIALSTFREATKKTGSDTSKASKNIISDALFRERAYLFFPEYALIVDDVAQSGYSKKVCRPLDLLCYQNFERFRLLRRLSNVAGDRIGSLPARSSYSKFIEHERSTNLGGNSLHHRQVSQRRCPRT